MSPLPDVPSALKLREHFDRNAKNRVKVRTTHAQLVELSRNPLLRFKDIAQSLNAKNASSGLAYYNRYVRPLLGLSGQDRQRERLRLKREASLRLVFEDDVVLSAICEAASNAGLETQRVHMQGMERKPLTHMFLHIGGILCQVHPVTRIWSPSPGKRYAQISFRRITTKFVLGPVGARIVVVTACARPRIFVFPAYVLDRLPVCSAKAKGWIPLHKARYRANQKHRIDWARYENAWHLLEGEDL